MYFVIVGEVRWGARRGEEKWVLWWSDDLWRGRLDFVVQCEIPNQ